MSQVLFSKGTSVPTTTTLRDGGIYFNTSNKNIYLNNGGTLVTYNGNNTSYSTATSSTAGLVKIGYTQSGKNYPVALDGTGKMYVNVPWTDTVYNHPNSPGVGGNLSMSGLWKTAYDMQGHVESMTLVTKEDITNLGIPAQDTVYTHPSYTAQTAGLYKIIVDSTGHVNGASAVTKSDITSLGIPAQDTTYNEATTTSKGLMSTSDKRKLDKFDDYYMTKSVLLYWNGVGYGRTTSWDSGGYISQNDGGLVNVHMVKVNPNTYCISFSHKIPDTGISDSLASTVYDLLDLTVIGKTINKILIPGDLSDYAYGNGNWNFLKPYSGSSDMFGYGTTLDPRVDVSGHLSAGFGRYYTKQANIGKWSWEMLSSYPYTVNNLILKSTDQFTTSDSQNLNIYCDYMDAVIKVDFSRAIKNAFSNRINFQWYELMTGGVGSLIDAYDINFSSEKIDISFWTDECLLEYNSNTSVPYIQASNVVSATIDGAPYQLVVDKDGDGVEQYVLSTDYIRPDFTYYFYSTY